ncbi:serine/threonine-protein kinase [Mangrovactinospora gilvigrisea]|nr:serine/threonine-protein kinase [Mangrovactinospora gilvigrisea]
MPEKIGRYTVVEMLGCGGMGEVYRAYSPAGDPVAVKLIRSDKLDPVARARFEKEAEIARTIIGTNRVARFLDADPYADRPWLAMDYVPGRTLLDYVNQEGPLPSVLVASLGALLSEGLAAVHAVGLLHRDLKPQNIILGDYGPIIIDFGLAAFADSGHGTLSNPGTVIGTVRCMPPEQAAGQTKVTPAADIYALGTVLLFAATGHYPYDGLEWAVIADLVRRPDVAPDLSGLPQELSLLVTGMMAHSPADRLSLDTAASMCTDLMAAAKVIPVQARNMLVDRTAPKPLRPVLLEQVLTPQWEAIQERLRQAALQDEDDEDGPLADGADVGADTSAAQSGDDVDEADVPSPSPPPEADRPTAPRRTPRKPASERVADELRERYAVHSSL